MVGGFLRDTLIGLPAADVDIVVSGDPFSEARALALAFGGHAIPLGQAHGLARVILGSGAGQRVVDVAGMRGGSIEADLALRDFTIGAMAMPLDQWRDDLPVQSIIDPYGGRRDVERQVVRMVSPTAFTDDPLRLLRAVALAARLGFTVEAETRSAIAQNAHAVTSVASERVREVFCDILAANRAKVHLALLDELGLLCAIIPELEEAKGVEQPREHYWDVFGHSLEAVDTAERVTREGGPSLVPWGEDRKQYFAQDGGDNLSRRTLLKLGCLLHDVAKPRTKTIDENGRTRFFGHHTMGADMTHDIMRRLRFSAANTEAVCLMVQNHLRPGQMSQGLDLPTARAIHRFFRDVKGAAVDTLYLSFADYLAARGPLLEEPDWRRHASKVSHIITEGERPEIAPDHPPLVDGHALMKAFGLAPGPRIGHLLEQVREAEAAGEVASREEGLAWVEQVLQHESAHDGPDMPRTDISGARRAEG